MTKAQCCKCRVRIEGCVQSEEQMTSFCKECKYLRRLESPGMSILPVYTMDVLAEAATGDLPILSRSGMMVPGK